MNLRLLLNGRKHRSVMIRESKHTQTNCVNWFRRTYPQYALLLFAVPNNAATNVIRGRLFKEEGLLKGVADLILLISNKNYHSLCIENKTQRQAISRTKSVSKSRRVGRQ